MYDIVIIGSGPAGLSAAVYAKRASKDVLVIEKDYEGKGQIVFGGRVDNYLGFPGISGLEMGENFRNHAIKLGAEIIEAKVTDISKKGDHWVVTVKKKKDAETIEAKTIIYGAGARHRQLGAKGESELTGMGVSYCATCDGALYSDAEVIVVGGGDTALDDALYLSKIASKVTLIHRRHTFRGADSTLEKLKKRDNVEIKTGYNIKEILGEDEVTGVVLDNDETLDAEGVFVAVGMIPQTELIKDIVKLDGAGYIVAGEDCRTSAEGFYAVGDVRTKPLRQVVTAVADGANAVNSIIADL